MDSDSALWNLGTIVQATATVFGLLIVAAIFYLQELKRHLDRTHWMDKHLAPRFTSAYCLSVSVLIVMAIVSLLCLVVAGMDLIENTMDTMSTIPGGDEALSEGLSGEVSHRVTEFITYLAKVFVGVFTWFAGILLVYTLDNLSTAKWNQLRSNRTKPGLPALIMTPEADNAGTSETVDRPAEGDVSPKNDGSSRAKAQNDELAPPK